MFNSANKYKKISSAVFLSAYFVFILISAIHFHHYDLNSQNCFNSESQKSSALLIDFLSESTNICAINHFSQTVLNLGFSSSDLFDSMPKMEEKVSYIYLAAVTSSVLHLISPRAPPAFS